MDYKEFPKPIIDALNALENWSHGKEVSFSRIETKTKGFSWVTNYNDDFKFLVYLKLNSPQTKEVYTWGVSGNPKDDITYDSQFHSNFGHINHPYKIDIDEKLIKIIDTEFHKWLDRVREFEGMTLFGKVSEAFYEKDFFDHFEIVEDDSDNTPFDLEKQLRIIELLEKTLTFLSQDLSASDETKKLIEQTTQLKSVVPKFSKNYILRKLAKLYAQIRLHGPELAKEIIKYWLTDGIKGWLN